MKAPISVPFDVFQVAYSRCKPAPSADLSRIHGAEV